MPCSACPTKQPHEEWPRTRSVCGCASCGSVVVYIVSEHVALTAQSGNFAQALAVAARCRGVPAYIVMVRLC